jgi:3-oxoacyl-[acyl-carrier protein] reductase
MNYLVTGGSRGLGLEIVSQLLQNDHQVYALSRGSSIELDKLLVQYSGMLEFLPCDLSRPELVRDVLFQAGLAFDIPIDGLINNAAMAYDDLATNLEFSRLEESFRVNVYAPMILSKHVIKNMLRHSTQGSLVHISSICAHTGFKGLAMYGATKGAIESFSKNLAREWGAKGIRSNCIAAGFMETEMSRSLDDQQRASIYRRTSLKKATSLQSVASTALYLLSDGSQSITGQCVHVDGGVI